MGLRAQGRVRGDVRLGEAWTGAQRLKNDLISLIVRALVAASALVPRTCLRAGGRLLGLAAYVLARRERRIALENAARALPELTPKARRRVVRRAYTNLGADLGDAVAMLRKGGYPLPLHPEARRVLERALAEGRGTIFVSAHLGPWERVATGLVAAGFPLTTIAREAYDPRLTELYVRLRSRHGVRAIFRGAPGAATSIVRTLRRGGLLGIPMDLRSRVPSVEVPFFGVLAPTAVGPARIALRSNAPVVVGTAAKADPLGLCITATRIEMDDLPLDAEGERRLTERINRELEARIRALPEHWVWMHERFAPSAPKPALEATVPALFSPSHSRSRAE